MTMKIGICTLFVSCLLFSCSSTRNNGQSNQKTLNFGNGGGITGASTFASLAAAGYKVLLIDRGDFGSAASQSPAL